MQDFVCQIIGYSVSLTNLQLLEMTSKQWHNFLILHVTPTYMSKCKLRVWHLFEIIHLFLYQEITFTAWSHYKILLECFGQAVFLLLCSPPTLWRHRTRTGCWRTAWASLPSTCGGKQRSSTASSTTGGDGNPDFSTCGINSMSFFFCQIHSQQLNTGVFQH